MTVHPSLRSSRSDRLRTPPSAQERATVTDASVEAPAGESEAAACSRVSESLAGWRRPQCQRPGRATGRPANTNLNLNGGATSSCHCLGPDTQIASEASKFHGPRADYESDSKSGPTDSGEFNKSRKVQSYRPVTAE